MTDARARCNELLADRATHDLSPEARRELNEMLMQHPEWETESFELAAAAIDLAHQPRLEVMPDTVRQRLQNAARTWSASSPRLEDMTTSTAPTPIQPVPLKIPKRRERSVPLGWLAAAAALAVAVVGWWPQLRTPAEVKPVELRQQLVAQATDAIKLEWGTTDDAAAKDAGGDVVWSPSRQQGFMRIRGLQINDPSVSQYQLWVFDRTRDERYPVDGGVFDVAAGEVVVPIRLAVPVSNAHLFAVTVEKPGGVVVSDRERIVLVATVEQDQG